jgi:hypothetical protein
VASVRHRGETLRFAFAKRSFLFRTDLSIPYPRHARNSKPESSCPRQVEFIKYYDAVIPFLTNILTTATDKTARMLRAKSMECISLVGMAVGKERFREDAKGVMQVLVGLQATQMEDDDPTISYMLQAWARLCKCLGQEFLPYLPTVMPPLLHSADLKADLKVSLNEFRISIHPRSTPVA